MKATFILLFVIFPLFLLGYDIDRIVITASEGKELNVIEDPKEIVRYVKLLNAPDRPYGKLTDPISLPGPLVVLVFYKENHVIGASGILIYESWVTKHQAIWSKVKERVNISDEFILGTNKGLTEAVITRIEANFPDYLDEIDPNYSLSKHNLREKAKLAQPIGR
ncbi:MAG: hypothetical protein AAF065_06145 [Verrucomicrobiota bacterium]